MQSLGVVKFRWMGVLLDVEKGASFKLPGYKNNPVNAGERTFRAQEWMHGEAKGTTVLKRGQSASDYNAGDEGELQIICDTGQTYTSPDAFIVDNPDITGGEGGKVQLVWNYSTVEELLS